MRTDTAPSSQHFQNERGNLYRNDAYVQFYASHLRARGILLFGTPWAIQSETQ